MELQERIDRGVKARDILDNELYNEAWQAIEQEITTQWKNAPIRDKEGQETLKLLIMLLPKLKGYFQTVMETGKLGELDLRHQETLIEKAKRTIQDW